MQLLKSPGNGSESTDRLNALFNRKFKKSVHICQFTARHGISQLIERPYAGVAGAIHRDPAKGGVVINDDTCIGCSTCANSCPYDNIRMVQIRDGNGAFIRDETTHAPLVKATKCDLCASNPGGPACVRACPHDALQRVDFEGGTIFEEFLR